MRKLIYLIAITFIFSCDNEKAPNCFQTAGKIVEKDLPVQPFTKIRVNRDIALVIKEAPEHSVIVKTGENLLNDIKAVVENGKLVLINNNETCNLFRRYGLTTIYVTAPNITEITCDTQYDITSDGVLTYPKLELFSEDFLHPDDDITSGNFYLQIENKELKLTFNKLSNIYISGTTDLLNATFASGTSRLEGADFIAQKIVFWNRSSNDMILHPVQELHGRIAGPGDVICVNKPPIVKVTELYKGKLIFK